MKNINNTISRKPLLVVRPSVINALFPLFLKNLLGFGIIGFGVFLLAPFVKLLIPDFPSLSFNLIFFLILLLTFLSISIKLFLLLVTRYYFFETNAIKEFKFIVIRRRSVVYTRITNVSVKISLWDRITGAGNITLHTGDDNEPDLVLSYIKKPIKIEELIYSLIHKKNKNVGKEVIN